MTEKIIGKLSKDKRTNCLFQKLPLFSSRERQKAANPNNLSLGCLSCKNCHLSKEEKSVKGILSQLFLNYYYFRNYVTLEVLLVVPSAVCPLPFLLSKMLSRNDTTHIQTRKKRGKKRVRFKIFQFTAKKFQTKKTKESEDTHTKKGSRERLF